MKLWILSDLHLEASVWDLPDPLPDFDVLVAAGDIHDPLSLGIEWLAERVDKPVIYVPGNHEWYAHRRHFTVEDEVVRARLLAAGSNVHLLMDEAVVVGGVRFLGATLWTDYELYGTPERSAAIAAGAMNDHRFIYPDEVGTPLRPQQARAWHEASRDWLADQLRPQAFAGPTVVVTHHVPHPRSIATRYGGDPLNPAFCSDLSEVVEGSGATLWVHGHTHASFDYMAGATRVICNPKGYGPRIAGGSAENSSFDVALIVEV